MARKNRRTNVTVSTSYIDPVTDEETAIEVECHATAGTRDYFDRSWGNWLPGDAPEVEILSAVADDGKDYLDAIEADPKWVDEIEEKALSEIAGDDDGDGYDGPDTREEARGER